MKIGEKTLKELASLAQDALITHINPLNVAFRNAGEKDFKIGLKGTINAGAGDGDFKLKIDIDYVIEKASDSFSRQVHEKQTSLNLDEPTKPCPLLREGDEVYVSVCAKCQERQSVIIADGVNLPVVYGRFEGIKHTGNEAMVQYRPCSSWADEDYKTWCDDMVRKAHLYLATPPVENKPEEKKKAKAKKAA